MSTTNGPDDDPQSHGRPPTEPHTPDQTPEARPRIRNALGWSALGLAAVFGATGVVLILTGHEDAGVELIKTATVTAGIRARK
ncbi:hypothetical protein ACFVTP_32840 [Streptomyces celluloflavus]|uniref:hypothetical protein n=1 Tax=Streptomyces celluloflavus TaxID=58344 RepID=UPI0036DE26B6